MRREELEKKEQNYIQEIMTLEHHIDGVNRQLEDLTQKFNKEIAEKDSYYNELNHYKNLNMS